MTLPLRLLPLRGALSAETAAPAAELTRFIIIWIIPTSKSCFTLAVIDTAFVHRLTRLFSACYEEFTAGQEERMYSAWERYRS